MTANIDCKENRHAQEVMKDLGIKYGDATPQSVGDQWWFWNCENMPEQLPVYLTEFKVNPLECVGFGLSQEQANRIRMISENKRKIEQMREKIEKKG